MKGPGQDLEKRIAVCGGACFGSVERESREAPGRSVGRGRRVTRRLGASRTWGLGGKDGFRKEKRVGGQDLETEGAWVAAIPKWTRIDGEQAGNWREGGRASVRPDPG